MWRHLNSSSSGGYIPPWQNHLLQALLQAYEHPTSVVGKLLDKILKERVKGRLYHIPCGSCDVDI